MKKITAREVMKLLENTVDPSFGDARKVVITIEIGEPVMLEIELYSGERIIDFIAELVRP